MSMNKIIFILLVALFTFSCSVDNEGYTGEYGSLTDSRDSKEYKTVVIGTQEWMAENLNYDDGAENSVCYDNLEINCNKYGKLYKFYSALTVCPEGWHLPSKADWNRLVDYAGTRYAAKLKAKKGWNGSDNYGFAALPAGRYEEKGFNSSGSAAWFWVSMEVDYYGAWTRHFYTGYNGTFGNEYTFKTDKCSVRCIRD